MGFVASLGGQAGMADGDLTSGHGFSVVTRTIITLQDDLDGSEAEETISSSLDGADYVIDLNTINAENRRTALRPLCCCGQSEKGPYEEGMFVPLS